MKRAIFSVLVISLGLLLKSCNTTEPPPPPPNGEKPTLELKLEDISCTESWIKLTTTNLELPATVTLKQFNPNGDTTNQILNLNTQDSLLYIDSLLPNKSYQYQVSSVENPANSNELSITTMDTTSHNFTFETFTFGGTAGSSTLYDVAIIDENNIWAVGEILVADTSHNGYTMYNAVRWDGTNWHLQQIMFYTICGQQNRTTYPASSVFAFSETEVWIAMDGDQIAKIENGVQSQTMCLPWSFVINKIWGSSSSNLYVVGNNGNIAFFNGTQWTRIESGTELNINDIWGDYNEKTSEWEILSVGGNILQGWESERIILKISNNQHAQQINLEGTLWPFSSIWFITNRKYYITGSGGNYKKSNLNEETWKSLNITGYFLYKLRGNEVNDIVATGGVGELVHFNGVNWESYFNETKLNYGNYYSIDIKNDLIVAVGVDAPSAVLIIGRRLN